jgi:hypothetical protein
MVIRFLKTILPLSKGEPQKWQEFKCLLAQVAVASYSQVTKPSILHALIAVK